MPDQITIEDLEVRFHVGVPDEERAEPQRLLITIGMNLDLGPSGANDNLAETIDYHAVYQSVKALGQARRTTALGCCIKWTIKPSRRGVPCNVLF